MTESPEISNEPSQNELDDVKSYQKEIVENDGLNIDVEQSEIGFMEEAIKVEELDDFLLLNQHSEEDLAEVEDENTYIPGDLSKNTPSKKTIDKHVSIEDAAKTEKPKKGKKGKAKGGKAKEKKGKTKKEAASKGGEEEATQESKESITQIKLKKKRKSTRKPKSLDSLYKDQSEAGSWYGLSKPDHEEEVAAGTEMTEVMHGGEESTIHDTTEAEVPDEQASIKKKKHKKTKEAKAADTPKTTKKAKKEAPEKGETDKEETEKVKQKKGKHRKIKLAKTESAHLIEDDSRSDLDQSPTLSSTITEEEEPKKGAKKGKKRRQTSRSLKSTKGQLKTSKSVEDIQSSSSSLEEEEEEKKKQKVPTDEAAAGDEEEDAEKDKAKRLKAQRSIRLDSMPEIVEVDEAALSGSQLKVAKKKGAKKKKEAKKKGAKVKKEEKKEKGPVVIKTEAQLEAEQQREQDEKRQKLNEEKRTAMAKEKRDITEDTTRNEQLEFTYTIMQSCDNALLKLKEEEQAAEEWRQYLVCDGLPAPWDVAGMNTYLHLWEKEIKTVSAEQCCKRTAEAIDLLHKLEDILDDPFTQTESKIKDWAWVASLFREHQALNLEYCTYRLLRDIKSNLNRISIPTADYRIEEDLFSMCLYVTVTLPTPVYNPRTVSRSRIQLEWPEMKVDVLFPASLKCDLLAIRGMYMKYDHFTDTCMTYKCSNIPPYYTKTLKQACHEELLCKMHYKYDHRVIVPKEPKEVVQEDGSVVVEEPEPEPEIPPNEMPPHVPYHKLEPSPSEHCLQTINDEMVEALNSLSYDEIPDFILNLRKYTVLGGVYCLDLFYQPPQPQGMVSYEVFISTLIEPCKLQSAPFMVEYIPPAAPEPGARRTPEEIEEELLQQEKELDELIFLTVILPKHVYWLETPMVTQWDEENNAWTTKDIFDFKNIEEKGYVTFRTGSFRPFAIATLRWTNLPFQAWEIRPEKNGTVTLQLTCAILTLEFHVEKNRICVKDVQCAPNDAFDEHLGVYYRFSKLRRIMRSIGMDVFPFYDTFRYVEGTCEKYWPMENHLYFCIALMSVVYNMTWSRWNMTLDNRTIVFQMRHYRFDRPKQANFDTVLVQPHRTLYIDCTEVSPEFSDAPMEGMRFFTDLWHLTRLTSTKKTKKRINEADQTMLKTLYSLFKNIRFFSFS